MKRTKQSTFAKRERQEKGTGFAPVGGAQFTPGPWHVEKCSAPVYGSDGMLMVNGVGIGAGSRHIGTISSKNAHNDANLIAAATAMYEALSKIAELRQQWRDDVIDSMEYMDELDALNFGALSQAEGR